MAVPFPGRVCRRCGIATPLIAVWTKMQLTKVRPRQPIAIRIDSLSSPLDLAGDVGGNQH